jgi:hypothetical protein
MLSGCTIVLRFIGKHWTPGYQLKAAELLTRFHGDAATIAQLMEMNREKRQKSVDEMAHQQQKHIASMRKNEKDTAKNEPRRRSEYQHRKRVIQLSQGPMIPGLPHKHKKTVLLADKPFFSNLAAHSLN